MGINKVQYYLLTAQWQGCGVVTKDMLIEEEEYEKRREYI